MFYQYFSYAVWAIALLVSLIAFKGFIGTHRIWRWVRVLFSSALLLVAGAFALVGWDLQSYRAFEKDRVIAVIQFEQVGPQAYIAKLTVSSSGELKEFYMKGDQWQVDARVLRWKGVGARIKPGYRLDRISGRYTSVNDEISKERTVYSLFSQDGALDLWAYAYKNHQSLPVLEAVYGSATYMPMSDGAQFNVALSNSGLLAKPGNEAAQQALKIWLN